MYICIYIYVYIYIYIYIEDALRASTAAPSLRDLSRGTLPKKIKEKVLKRL